MKSILFTTILSVMFFPDLFAQNKVYDSIAKKHTFKNEDLDVKFTPSDVEFALPAGKELAPALIALLPSLVEGAFNLTTTILEKNAKKFSAEYSFTKSNIDAGNRKVPNFTVVRTVTLDEKNKSAETALSIDFKAKEVDGIKAFVYYVDKVDLNYSSAAATSRSNRFDYTIEIKVTYLVDGSPVTQELSPIVLSSVGFGSTSMGTEFKRRTSLIPIPDGGVFSEVSVKIVETNPAKVRAEKILAAWNENKDKIKTVITDRLPKEKEEEEEEDEKKDEKKDKNSSTGNH